jgi:hypothetical protein
MKKDLSYSNYHEIIEYHGNTEVERIRKQCDEIIEHDWLIFNSVDEAMEYFNEKCNQSIRYYN